MKLLHKFMGPERIKGIIESNESIMIRATQPSLLNDPFELFPKSFSNNNRIEELSFEENMAYNSGKKTEKQIIQLTDGQKESNYFHYNKGLISQRKIFDSLNDYFGIMSFSGEKRNNTLMWSYYGKDHKGVCLGFDVNDPLFLNDEVPNVEKKTIKLFKKVEYNNNRIGVEEIISLVENESAKPFLDLVFRKNEDWKYEDESRVVISQAHPSLKREYIKLPECKKEELGEEEFSRISTEYSTTPILLYPIPIKSLKEIIIGAKTPETLKVKLVKFGESKGICVYQSKPCSQTYLMKREPIFPNKRFF